MSFSASDVERQHYVVMSAVLENPSENWPAVIVRLGITKEQLFSSLDYLDRERYVSGMRFARGGQKEILVPFTEKAAITERGIDFMKRMEVKKNKTDETTRPTVFVSYNDKSGREFVDALVTETKDIAQIIRYTDMGAWESFKEFMNSIRKQDFAVLVITDAYLKSYACLYEVMELMKEENWLGKTMFVIFDDAHNAFTAAGRASYIGFWNQKCNELEETIQGLPPASTSELSVELKKSELIRNEIGTFLTAVGDTSNPPVYLAIARIKERIHGSNIAKTSTYNEPATDKIKNEDSLRILSLACANGGMIIASSTLSGFSITIDQTVLVNDCLDGRENARWREAMHILEIGKMIEPIDAKKELFRVTDKGYKIISAAEIKE
jgi:hypothetical protein